MRCLPDAGASATRSSGLCHAGVMGQLEKIWSDAAGRGPPDRGGPHGQQRLRPALPPHRVTPCSSTPPTSTRRCSRSAGASGVNQVVETHGHWDHIQAVPAVREAGHLGGRDQRRRRHAAQLRPHPRRRRACSAWATCASRRWPRRATRPAPSASPSRGRNLLFTGDTLFPGGPGNTVFEGGDFATIIQSIDRRIFAALRARHPGPARPRHRPPRSGNEAPHLQEWVDRGW